MSDNLVAAGAHAAGQAFSELQPQVCLGQCQLLGIGIHCDELDAVNLFPYHPGDSITTGSSETNYLDVCSNRYKIRF
jgi:hypothetical protein